MLDYVRFNTHYGDMDTHPQTLTPRAVRHGLIEFMSKQTYTHALTLNTDRQLTLPRLKSIFSTFCHNLDRAILGQQDVKGYPHQLRFNAIAFPEHLDTNAHLHAYADLRSLTIGQPDERLAAATVYRAWTKSTREAGSVDVQRLRGDGFAWYSTKAMQGTDPAYFLAADFHPN